MRLQKHGSLMPARAHMFEQSAIILQIMLPLAPLPATGPFPSCPATAIRLAVLLQSPSAEAVARLQMFNEHQVAVRVLYYVRTADTSTPTTEECVGRVCDE